MAKIGFIHLPLYLIRNPICWLILIRCGHMRISYAPLINRKFPNRKNLILRSEQEVITIGGRAECVTQPGNFTIQLAKLYEKLSPLKFHRVEIFSNNCNIKITFMRTLSAGYIREILATIQFGIFCLSSSYPKHRRIK